MIRSVLTLLIALCVLARAAWPALPTYVCAGMGGVRLAAPCCPEEGAHSDSPAWAARCCQPEGPARGDVQAPPPAPQRPELAAALAPLPWQGILLQPPRLQPPRSARAHSGMPPPHHGHHVVLRI